MNVTEIKFTDGRIYRVASANQSQIDRIGRAIHKLGAKIEYTKSLTSGVCNVKEFEKHADLIANNIPF